MFNIFAYLRNKREQKRRRARLAILSSVFSGMERLEKRGLLLWEQKTRRLFIAEPLAIVFVAQGLKTWRTFLNNLYLYQTYRLQQKQWNDHIINEQAKAVRRRKAQVTILTKAEVERIRRATADKIMPEDIPLPTISPFEFFILTDDADDQAKARITWVGEYDPDTEILDMAAWEEVKHAIQKK